jgi:hypothetical protein
MRSRYPTYALSLSLALACSANQSPQQPPSGTSSGAVSESRPASGAPMDTDAEVGGKGTMENSTSSAASGPAGLPNAPASSSPTDAAVTSSLPSSTPSASINDDSSALQYDGGNAPLRDPSAELYDPERLPEFHIELSEEAVATLSLVSGSDDPRQDTYVKANFRYGEETLGDIGLRIKGEGSFQQLDAKPAWKLKFDEFVPDQSFRGLKRMTLNNLFEDPSFIAERLAYDVYRAASVPAPRCNNALVYVNGEFYGVYANVEAEDKPFLRRWFDDDGGNLYEEGQSDFVPGAEATFDLETNEARNDRTDLVGLIEAIDSATAATFLDDVGAHLDIENYLKFTAIEAAVNQWDMYSYTVFWVNNLRLYRDPTAGKFHFIPWGHDLSMKPYRDSGKPYVHLFDLSRQYDAPNGQVSAGLLFRRCLESAPCIAAYRQAVEDVIVVYEALDLEARAAAYYEQIKPFVYDDERKRVCCGSELLSDQEFDVAVASVTQTIRGRVAALRRDLDTGP